MKNFTEYLIEDYRLDEKMLKDEFDRRVWVFTSKSQAKQFLLNNAFHFQGIRASVDYNDTECYYCFVNAHDMDHDTLSEFVESQLPTITDLPNGDWYTIGYPDMNAFDSGNYELDFDDWDMEDLPDFVSAESREARHDNNKYGARVEITGKENIEKYKDVPFGVELAAVYDRFEVSPNMGIKYRQYQSIEEATTAYENSKLGQLLGKPKRYKYYINDDSKAIF